MIRLTVEEYCQECPDFKAEVDKTNFESSYGIEFTNTFISCKNADRCRCIKRYIEKEIEKDD